MSIAHEWTRSDTRHLEFKGVHVMPETVVDLKLNWRKRRNQRGVPFSVLTNFDSRFPQLVLQPFIGRAG